MYAIFKCDSFVGNTNGAKLRSKMTSFQTENKKVMNQNNHLVSVMFLKMCSMGRDL